MRTPSPTVPAPSGRRPHRATGHLWAAGLCALPATVLLALVAVEWGPLLALDRTVATGLHESARESPGFTQVNRVLTDWVWDPWTMRLALLLAVLALLLSRRGGGRTTALWLLVTLLIGSVLQQGLKFLVDRPRPRWREPVDSAHYAAFPSGHAMTAAFVCVLLLWLAHRAGVRGALMRAAAAAAAVSVAGVGFTRVYLGVHWPSDVVGGWLLGAAAASAAVAAHHRYGAQRTETLEPPGTAGE
ncbi:phosphatase PAP2 family protein [Streptomyces sp. WAC 00631]|uniref:phosphatase PAP2 family protein n=1 Tax=Streptomyces sp. WAC 00631 TaxID=2203201 RepID=UPI001E372951|nr:phosphatase PAP2 family protein [Streptomyces sp. WAC 00631]MCC5036818.1 phosphatase PAP2 family protein [Streptomyces sp. WAC 00631]